MNMKQLIGSCGGVLGVVMAAQVAALDACASLVADPYRAVNETWKRQTVKGKDFWLLLLPSFLDLPGVSEQDFVAKSGTQWVNTQLDPVVQRNYRTITIRDVKALDAGGATVPAEVSLTCDERDAVCWTSDSGALVVSCPIGPTEVRYLPAVGKLSVKASAPFSRLDFGYGDPMGAKLAGVRGMSVAAEFTFGANGKGSAVLAAPTRDFACELVSDTYHFTIRGLVGEEKLRTRLENAPFSVYNRVNIWGCLNAPKGVVNTGFFREVEKRYPETFLGVEATEWDANFLQKINHGPTSNYLRDLGRQMKFPCDREEMIRNLLQEWDNYLPLNGTKMFGMSGGLTFNHYAADAGATVSCYETTEGIGAHLRISHMYDVSAARQFGIGSSVYTAYFKGPCYANSAADPRLKGNNGLDFGSSPSYNRRSHYLAYYMGVNYLSFETQWQSQVKEIEKGRRYELTGNGRAIKDIYDWSEKPEGKRGEWYAPIMLLKDRRSADDHKYALDWQPYAFYSLFDATYGDAYIDKVIRSISPGSSGAAAGDEAIGRDAVNSELADIFCVYMANPARSSEVSYEEFCRYPVVMAIGDMHWTRSLVDKLRKYVAAGGTLVLTVSQADAFDEAFCGWKRGKGTVEADGLVLDDGRKMPRAEVVMATKERQLPLVVKSGYGEGNVLTVTSPDFRCTGKWPKCNRVPDQLRELLKKLQNEVLPVPFEGRCDAVYNVMPDGTWRIMLANHDGVVKDPWSSFDEFRKGYDRAVTFTLPKGAAARETRLGVKGAADGDRVTFTIPAGEILVVEVKGVKAVAKGAAKDPKWQPTWFFNEKFSASGKPFDGFRYDPARRAKEQAEKNPTPEVLGEWLAKNEFRDTSGLGHDLTVTGPVEFRDGVAVMKKGGPTFVSYRDKFKRGYYDAPYQVNEGTFETWVKPSANQEDFASGGGRSHQGGVFMLGERHMLLYSGGRWQLSSSGYTRRSDMLGPVAKPEWTHLCVTFRGELMRWYVNGVEVKGDNGPMRKQESWSQGKDAFYDSITPVYGSLVPSWGYHFRGEMKGLRYLSRCCGAEEVERLAQKEW